VEHAVILSQPSGRRKRFSQAQGGAL